MSTAGTDADQERLEELYRSQLLDSPPEESFDRITRLARQILKVDAAFISLVDRDRQYLKSRIGDVDDVADRSEPLSYSFCKYAVAAGERFVVENAPRDPLVRASPAVENGVVAYAGEPLATTSGNILGTLCVIYHQPHDWSEDELALLSELTAMAVTEIEYRLRSREIDQIRAVSDELAQPVEELGDAVRAVAHLSNQPENPRLPRMADTALRRMQIVETLARTLHDKSHARPAVSPSVDLRSVVERATRLVQSGSRPGDLLVEIPDHPVVAVAMGTLDRPVAALIQAGMQHLGENGPLLVELVAHDGNATLRVLSSGAGLAVSELLRLVSKFHPDVTGAPAGTTESASVSRRGRSTHVQHGAVAATTGPDGFEFRVTLRLSEPEV